MEHTRTSGRRQGVVSWFAVLAAMLIPLGVVFVGGADSKVGSGALHGYNVQTVALQAPSSQLAPAQPSIVVLSASQENERMLAAKFGG